MNPQAATWHEGKPDVAELLYLFEATQGSWLRQERKMYMYAKDIQHAQNIPGPHRQA